MNPQTIVKEEYKADEIVLNSGLSEDRVLFTVYGQTPERSYEDRDVYFSAEYMDWESNFISHLKAEDAIKLGQLLVEHGTKALLANMYQHQRIHHSTLLTRYINEGRVDKIIMTVIDENPANHGEGYRTYLIKPIWKDGKVPEFQEDFEFEQIIYWSPFEDEYTEQLSEWLVPIEFVGYDRAAEVEAFNKSVEEFSGDGNFKVVE